MDDAFRFGIEEEYFLADKRTGGAPPVDAANRFHAAAAKRVDPAAHELLKGQVEVSTKPGTDCAVARETLRGLRRDLARIAEEQELVLFAAGSHPLAEAKSQETTDEARYEKLKNEFGIIAQRSMCCAMHVHVEVPDPGARIAVMNRMLPYLPIFLALSASSPFWQGQDSGLRAFRLAAFREWPRMGLPEIFADDAEFERFVDLLVAGKMMKDASFLWWLIRPSTHYPTIELRICDSCTRVEDAAAIAALYRSLVRCVVRRTELNKGIGPIERAVTAENIWQAQRHGVGATLVHIPTRAPMPLADALQELLDLVAEDAEALGCAAEVASTGTIGADGTSADWQLATYGRARHAGLDGPVALRDLVLDLARTTIA